MHLSATIETNPIEKAEANLPPRQIRLVPNLLFQNNSLDFSFLKFLLRKISFLFVKAQIFDETYQIFGIKFVIIFTVQTKIR